VSFSLGSLELDNPPVSSSNLRGEKRKFALLVQNEQKLNPQSSDNYFILDNYPSALNNFVASKQNQNSLQLSSQTNSHDNSNCFPIFGTKQLSSDKNSISQKIKCNLTGNNPFAAAASQAIAATHTQKLGRTTASLKASYEAINSGFSNFNLNQMRLDDSDPNAQNILLKSEYMDSDKTNKKSRISKKGRITQYNFELDGNVEVTNEIINPANEPRYCFCNNVSYGEMIYCENTLVSSLQYPLLILNQLRFLFTVPLWSVVSLRMCRY